MKVLKKLAALTVAFISSSIIYNASAILPETFTSPSGNTITLSENSQKHAAYIANTTRPLTFEELNQIKDICIENNLDSIMLPFNIILSQDCAIKLVTKIVNIFIKLPREVILVPETNLPPYNKSTLTIEEVMISLEDFFHVKLNNPHNRSGLILSGLQGL